MKRMSKRKRSVIASMLLEGTDAGPCKTCGNQTIWRRRYERKRPAHAIRRWCTHCQRSHNLRYMKEKGSPRYRFQRYGLTEEQYDEMFLLQTGLCAICDKRRATDIDHCHETGRVRGLLCGPCNRGLGHFKDDPEALASAVGYLVSRAA